jgi:transaldolase
MKFFIDTANIEEIKEAASIGILDGVTTNPTLISRENEEPKTLFKKISEIVDGPIAAEVVSLDWKGIVAEGKELVKINNNIVVKIPINKEGLKATKALNALNIKTMLTLIFTPVQALLAARAGADYITPFVGRLDDISSPGMDLIANIMQVYNNYNLRTEVIVASIRNPVHVLDAAMIGAHVATIPLKIIEQLVKHPLTDKGIESFLKDWEKVKQAK